MEMLKTVKKYLFQERSKIGIRINNRSPFVAPAVPELLESLRCHKDDEYPVISAEDETPIPPLACSFSKAKNSAHVLALADENGSLVVYNTNKNGDDAIVSDWVAHSNAIFDVKWACHEGRVLTASGDQTVCLWDAATKHKLLTFKGHTSSVRSVNFRPHDDAVFASGSRDGHVRLWDVRCNLKESHASSVNVIRNAHTVPLQPGTRRKKLRQGMLPAQDSQQSVTSVVFQDDNLLATGGAVDGCVKVWDVRKLKPDNAATVYQFPYAGTSKRTHGFSSLTFDPYMSRLFASCTDDVIYCYNFISYSPQPVCTYRGHRNTSFYVKAVVSPDSKYLLSGSSDESAYIWQVDNPNASPVILKGHRSEISDVAWCQTDLFRIVTTSDDNTMRVWRYDPTVGVRRKLGQSDKMYDITGYAELTHRDIGVSAESSSKVSSSQQSPKPSLKRAATFPFGTVTELTPKRQKTPAVSTPSPSIKMWLKRGASEGSPGPSSPSQHKQIKLRTEAGTAAEMSSQSRPKQIKIKTEAGAKAKSENERAENLSDKANCDSESVTKAEDTIKESQSKVDINLKEEASQKREVRKSCKRKLEVSDNGENVKRSRLDTDQMITTDKQDENGNKVAAKDVEYDNPKSENSNKVDKQSGSPGKKMKSSPRKRSPLKENSYSPKRLSPSKSNNGSPRKLESALQDLSSAINASPVKGELQRREFSSPAAVRMLSLNSKHHLQSPTANLPNSVRDGPNIQLRTPPHKELNRKKQVDWLTQMRMQKLAGGSPKAKGCSSKLLDKLDQAAKQESSSSQSQESSSSQGQENSSQNADKPAPSTPKLKSPVRGVKPITSFFRRGACAS